MRIGGFIISPHVGVCMGRNDFGGDERDEDRKTTSAKGPFEAKAVNPDDASVEELLENADL